MRNYSRSSRNNVAPTSKLKAAWRKLNPVQLTAVVALVVGLGVFVVWSVFAGSLSNYEPETFTASSASSVAFKTDPTAANGGYVEFLAPAASTAVTPSTTTSPLAGQIRTYPLHTNINATTYWVGGALSKYA